MGGSTRAIPRVGAGRFLRHGEIYRNDGRKEREEEGRPGVAPLIVAMSFPPAIPQRVARRQSPPPLHRLGISCRWKGRCVKRDPMPPIEKVRICGNSDHGEIGTDSPILRRRESMLGDEAPGKSLDASPSLSGMASGERRARSAMNPLAPLKPIPARGGDCVLKKTLDRADAIIEGPRAFSLAPFVWEAASEAGGHRPTRHFVVIWNQYVRGQ
jgi:hypothetical protein